MGEQDFKNQELNVNNILDFNNIEIAIVGLGLIGGSLAMALRRLNPKKIWGVDIDKEVLRSAEELGVIDGGFRDGSEVLKNSDLVIISLYPENAVNFIEKSLGDFKPHAVITDTAGIKSKMIDKIRSFLREDLDFVGGHPLAGKECSGFPNASAEIFKDTNYLLTPNKENKKESLLLLGKLIKGIGCREPILLEPEEHDRIIALTSQLPHVIAASLINSTQNRNTRDLIGGSFRDATRVAKMNIDLWSELLLENKENVLTQIETFMDNITKMKLAIEYDDSESLRELLESAGRAKGAI